MSEWLVLKFGGSSVADPHLWPTIAGQVRQVRDQGKRPLLVLSALKNVSNLLEALLHQAVAGVHTNAIYHLKEMHFGFASQLGLSVESELLPLFEQLEADCNSIFEQQVISPEYHARVVSCGELLSTEIGAAYLRQQNLDADCIDVREFLIADNIEAQDPWHHFTSNQCDYQSNSDVIEQMEQRASTIVTQGFIAADRQGRTVLLGREGSDTSASYLASILAATSVTIWTDVPGVFSFNPRIISEALQIKQLDYQQAEQLARAGAKVLHPRAIKPASASNIPVVVRSTQLPQHPGTCISNQPAICQQVLAMAQVSSVVLVECDIEDKRDIIEKMLPLGFDNLDILSEATPAALFYFSNTELQQPSAGELANHLAPFKVSVKDHLSALSLIGNKTATHWFEQVSRYCDTHYPQKYKMCFKDAERGQLTLMVEGHDELLFAQQLHRGLVEENHRDACFSEHWSQFVER